MKLRPCCPRKTWLCIAAVFLFSLLSAPAAYLDLLFVEEAPENSGFPEIFQHYERTIAKKLSVPGLKLLHRQTVENVPPICFSEEFPGLRLRIRYLRGKLNLLIKNTDGEKLLSTMVRLPNAGPPVIVGGLPLTTGATRRQYLILLRKGD